MIEFFIVPISENNNNKNNKIDKKNESDLDRFKYLKQLRIQKKKELINLISNPILKELKAFYLTGCLIESSFYSAPNSPQREKSLNNVEDLIGKEYNNNNENLIKLLDKIKFVISEYDGIIIEMRILFGNVNFLPDNEINAVNIIYNHFKNNKENSNND